MRIHSTAGGAFRRHHESHGWCGAVASVVGVAGLHHWMQPSAAGGPGGRCLCLGMGGGSVPMFLSHHFPKLQVPPRPRMCTSTPPPLPPPHPGCRPKSPPHLALPLAPTGTTALTPSCTARPLLMSLLHCHLYFHCFAEPHLSPGSREPPHSSHSSGCTPSPVHP